ncbi:hypothetical protein [Marinicella litoralis]|uniref:Uncharacterized protein n=1 Tax=Marinicella litoralis TaxID=644220 RepID=A0A4R6XRR5_9GAMM|nr:hypothetical protein [Marinicella litoralis]TDR20704.1 hypothetical protein C8D91_1682 [Marinicella litoralis]
MKKNIVSPSIQIGLITALITLLLIALLTDYSYANNDALIKHVFDEIYLLNYMLIMATSALVLTLLAFVLTAQLDGSKTNIPLVQRAKRVLFVGLFILIVLSLLYFSMHQPINILETWVKTIYWTQSVFLSSLIGGLAVLIYILTLSNDQAKK